MDDSDDYFGDDDPAFDEASLALLDQVESEYRANELKARDASQFTQPLPKKLKRYHSWKNGQLRRSPSFDPEDLPEISVQGDGSYGFHRTGATSSSNAQPNVTPNTHARPSVTAVFRSAANKASLSLNTRPSSGPSSVTPRAEISTSVPTPLHRAASSVQSAQRPNGTQTSQTTQDKITRHMRVELELLKARLDEQDKAQADLRKKLQEAEEARWAKEGEVKILRSGIEKTVEQHNAELDKIRAAKEAAEAKQVELQKKLKEEMDQLKTQFMFKQHELEMGIRKTPWTARTKKFDKNILNSPVPVPSQIRQWSTSSRSAGPSVLAGKVAFDGSPRLSQHTRKQAYSKDPNLPGFQNAFYSTPLKSKKGKERAPAQELRFEHPRERETAAHTENASMFAPGAPPSSPPRTPVRPRKHTHFSAFSSQPGINDAVLSNQMQPETLNEIDAFFSDAGAGAAATNVDVEMADEETITQPGPEENSPTALEEPIELDVPDPKEELKRIILTHSMLSDKTGQLTFQLLINSPLPPSAPAEHVSQYNNASKELLEMLGSIAKLVDYNTHLRIAARSLTRMAYILITNASLPPLMGLVHLIRVLLYSIPPFSASLLSKEDAKDPEDLTNPGNSTPPRESLIMIVIREVVICSKGCSPEESASSLLLETLGLIETLCWTAPDNMTDRLALIPKNHEVLMALISSSLPLSILQRSIKMLAFLASHAELYKHFLSYPDQTSSQVSSSRRYRHIPQIEQLAGYLIDSKLEGAEYDSFKEDILSLFIAIAIANVEAVDILNQSEKLIPSIVMYVSKLSAAFWEEDPDVMESPTRMTSVMRIINRATSLLFYMVFTPSPRYNLAQRLHYTDTRPFNGIMNMFTVSMGRFAFADIPPWVNFEVRVMLEHTNDLAATLLEAVATNPELEMVWAAFQQPVNEHHRRHPAEESNDDEREALLAHPVPDEE